MEEEPVFAAAVRDEDAELAFDNVPRGSLSSSSSSRKKKKKRKDKEKLARSQAKQQQQQQDRWRDSASAAAAAAAASSAPPPPPLLDPRGECGDGVMRWCLADFDTDDRPLGRGKYGQVYRATVRRTRQEVALKVLDKQQLCRDDMWEQLRQEVEIHSRLKHRNILQLYGYFYDPKYIYLILEYAPGGELYKAMKAQPEGKFSEKVAANFIEQLASGLWYCHRHNVIHRDVKPENLLLSHAQGGFLKLADFGWAAHDRRGYSGYMSTVRLDLTHGAISANQAENDRVNALNAGHRRTTLCGTLDYLTPEEISGKAYDEMVDNWTVGILAYELLVGHPPFVPTHADEMESLSRSSCQTPHSSHHPGGGGGAGGYTPSSQYSGLLATPQSCVSDNEATFKKIRKLEYHFPSHVSREAKDLIRRLLHRHPERRLSLYEVMRHPWIRAHCAAPAHQGQ